MKYVIYFLLGIIVVLIVVIISKTMQIIKTLRASSNTIEDIDTKIQNINDSTEKIKKSFSTSFTFFITIGSVISIINAINSDYKTTDKEKRNLAKSAIKGCIKKPSSVKKLVSR